MKEGWLSPLPPPSPPSASRGCASPSGVPRRLRLHSANAAEQARHAALNKVAGVGLHLHLVVGANALQVVRPAAGSGKEKVLSGTGEVARATVSSPRHHRQN